MDDKNTNANPIADETVVTTPAEVVVEPAPASMPVAEEMPASETTPAPEAPVADMPAETPAQA